jgi:hypothetical protein
MRRRPIVEKALMLTLKRRKATGDARTT